MKSLSYSIIAAFAWCANAFKKPKANAEVAPVLDLIDHLVGGDEVVLDWLLCWLAYPLQKPGAKLDTAVYMYGGHGSGKTLLFSIMADIYREEAEVSDLWQLTSKFNAWCSGKRLVIFDGIAVDAKSAPRLKYLITSRLIQVTAKGQLTRIERNRMNLVILTNAISPGPVEHGDCRFLLIEAPPARAPAYYQELVRWRASGGVEAFRQYLLGYDIVGFDPAEPAPVTAKPSEVE